MSAAPKRVRPGSTKPGRAPTRNTSSPGESLATRLDGITSSATEAILTLDADGIILGWNPAATRLFGHSRPSALGKPITELLVPEHDRTRFTSILRKSLDRVSPAPPGRVSRITAEGSTGSRLDLEMVLTRLETKDPTPLLTAQFRLPSNSAPAAPGHREPVHPEHDFIQLKSRFLCLVSHEFRTPLAIILSTSEILEAYFERLPEAKRQAHLRTLVRATKRIGTLLDQVGLIQKTSESKAAVNRSRMDLGRFCRSLVEEVLTETEHRNPVDLELSAGLPEATGDPVLLRQILKPPLTNAIVFSAADSPIGLRVRQEDPFAVFEISDSGSGIPEEHLEQVFEPFFRSPDVETLPGLGLGLAIARNSAHQHDGEMRIVKNQDRGTRVVIRIPLFPSGESPGQSLKEL